MNDTDKKTLGDAVKSIDASMTRMDAERDNIKQLKADICKDLQLNKKVFSKVVKAYHKGNRDEEQAIFESFTTLYEEVT